MKTNFREAIKEIVLWKNPEAFPAYTKLYIAGFSALLSLPFIGRLKNFSGFEEISMVTVGYLIYKFLLPKFNKDSLAVWTLIYGYFSVFLLILQSVDKPRLVKINGGTT